MRWETVKASSKRYDQNNTLPDPLPKLLKVVDNVIIEMNRHGVLRFGILCGSEVFTRQSVLEDQGKRALMTGCSQEQLLR